MSAPDAPLAALLATLHEVAREAVMPRFLNATRNRKPDGSLLTEADLAAQAMLQERLPRIIDCPVLGEEMPRAQQDHLWHAGRAGLWCIDPIDGTSNFANGIPCFAISAAYLENGETLLGAVFNPAADECYAAQRGAGAWLNGVPLPLRAPAGALSGAIAGVDFKRLPPYLRAALVSAPPYHSQRNFGASALEWCYVAAGRLDVYLHGGQMLWDFAAGRLILAEAGGAFATLEDASPMVHPGAKTSVVAAADAALLAAWQDWLAACRRADAAIQAQ